MFEWHVYSQTNIQRCLNADKKEKVTGRNGRSKKNKIIERVKSSMRCKLMGGIVQIRLIDWP